MKPKIPNQRNEYKKLNERLNRYVLMVEDIYSSTVEEVAKMAAMVGYDGTGEFHFADYPQLKAKVDEVFTQWVGDMESVVYRGTSEEWKNSNLVQDLLVNKVLKAYDAQVSGEKYKVYYDPNSDALKTFQKRRDRGMNLSDKLWKQEKSLRYELEEAISTAITKGTSAVTLSKRISKYLKDYPSLERDYKAKYGKATRSSDCEYRSIRLARSEINMAYRSSENERWRKLDFVVGYEIKVSHKHKVADICDDLTGKYPKDFEWVGWHPNCTDYKIPILKTEDEFFSVDSKPSVNEVKDVPDSFKNWVRDNQASIKRAEARGTAPYFVRDNRKLVDGLMKKELPKPMPLSVSNSDVSNTELSALRRGAKNHGVDMSELEKFIMDNKLSTRIGDITEKEDQMLRELHDKFEEQIFMAQHNFNMRRRKVYEYIDEHYKFGDFADIHKRAVTQIAVSDDLPLNAAMAKLDEYESMLAKEYDRLATQPIRLTAKFKPYNAEKYLDADNIDHVVSAIEEAMDGLYGSTHSHLRSTINGLSAPKAKAKAFGKEYNNGLHEVLESVNKLRELQSIDWDDIYTPWKGRFNDYIARINAHDILKNGYADIYNDIEGAYNIWKLSTNPRAVKYGLQKLSFNTPNDLIEEFAQMFSNPFEALADKEFYDAFETYVPIWFRHVDEAHYHSRYKHVLYDLSDRVADNIEQAVRLQYHEFGHAMDWLQGEWRKHPEWIRMYEKYSDMVNADRGYVGHSLFNGATYRRKLEEVYYRKTTVIHDNEKIAALTDVIQALDEDHINYIGGHSREYFMDGGIDSCLAEIIAHASEAYWQGNRIFAEVFPGLYDELKKIYKQFFDKYKTKKH